MQPPCALQWSLVLYFGERKPKIEIVERNGKFFASHLVRLGLRKFTSMRVHTADSFLVIDDVDTYRIFEKEHLDIFYLSSFAEATNVGSER